ncbi:cell envelope integrity protein CreD [Siccirubricoccus phaeus]|uniref:cell envelope integrity protein CreD n=1 Tax=Siccirubricoccus phaeus TaxID=2595053 RepID=UPI00165B874D|nr:cell envelope integrity protein CreD [Siccirubricoccus phaeus]
MSDAPPAAAAPPGILPRRPLLSGPMRRLLSLGVLFALLQLPQCMVGKLIDERQQRQAEARLEIGGAWGPSQAVLGPVLVVPWERPGRTEPERGTLTLLPQRLEAEASLAPETRRRGLFAAVVYTARMGMQAQFSLPQSLPPGLATATLRWPEAELVIGASQWRAGTAAPALEAAGRALQPNLVEPPGWSCQRMGLMRFPLGLDRPFEGSLPVRAQLELRGADMLRLLPLAGQVALTLRGEWASPSFLGTELPQEVTQDGTGFRASWETGLHPPLLRLAGPDCEDNRSLGVTLLEAVPTYRMINRTAKYAMLFLALGLVTYLLFEQVGKLRLHLAQYALLGLSLVLFPLLLLAFGEALGFALGYALSAAMVLGQATAWTGAVTRRAGLTALFGAMLAGLFGFIYVVLSLESYALLAGAMALFAALSAVMLAARRVNWEG